MAIPEHSPNKFADILSDQHSRSEAAVQRVITDAFNNSLRGPALLLLAKPDRVQQFFPDMSPARIEQLREWARSRTLYPKVAQELYTIAVFNGHHPFSDAIVGNAAVTEIPCALQETPDMMLTPATSHLVRLPVAVFAFSRDRFFKGYPLQGFIETIYTPTVDAVRHHKNPHGRRSFELKVHVSPHMVWDPDSHHNLAVYFNELAKRSGKAYDREFDARIHPVVGGKADGNAK